MSGIKKTGSFLGKVVGTVTGEPIKFIGKKLNNDYIQEIGDGIKKATTNTGTTLGSIAEGTWNTASGLIDKDEAKKDEGIKELKNTAILTAKGMGQSIKSTYINGKDVVQGVVTNDKDQLIKGAKGIGKTVAVATLAVGALDMLDVIDVVDIDGVDNHVQADTIDSDMGNADVVDTNDIVGDAGDEHIHHIETRNEDLAGEHHPVTGVEFESKVVTLPSGVVIEGVFPEFESEYTATLPESMYLESDGTHFSYANEQLAEAINQNSELGNEFTDSQRAQIFGNETPEGYTWHHSEEPGKLELVDKEVHAETGHDGGREIWGGGSENR
ncbi:HNH endonuclease [Neobacillus mesonae]|uniref:HNH endonuclease n=1 Tax=Neobacillus mesonae TaxID=1193713 RepID=UPI00203ECB4E|nr:HNH endonuclease [Neobacillus mesonae]MCM3571069.1 HNH endonuclease [Neobacillus mesonae]